MSTSDSPLGRSEEDDKTSGGRKVGDREQRDSSQSQPSSQPRIDDSGKPASSLTDGEALQLQPIIGREEIWDFALIFVKNPIASVMLIAMVAIPVYLAWPVSLYLALTLIGVFAALCLPSESVWRKAALSVLLPASVGFVLVILMLVLMNFLVHTKYVTLDYVITYDRLNWIDFALLRVHEKVEGLKHLWLLQWMFLLILIPIARFSTSVPMVDWALKLKRALAFAIPVVALVTSFSFIADDSVSGGLANGLVENIEVMYGINMSSARVKTAEGVSARIVAAAVSAAGPNDLAVLFHLSELGESYERTHRVRRQDILDSLTSYYIGYRWLYGQDASTAPAAAQSEDSLETAGLKNKDPPEALRASEGTADAAMSFREKEERAAIEEIVKTLAAAVPKKLSDFARDWIGRLIEEEDFVLLKLANELLGEVRDKAFEKRIEPTVVAASSRLREHLDDQWARVTDFALLDPRVERETTGFVEASRSLREKARRDHDEAYKGMGITEESKRNERFRPRGAK